ncbi:hypothetical protein Q7267_09255 [Glaesserella parasuis]|nr:hypothetical protein [Glaesserella parasuis]MDP0284209.1 hypothetical protein [Glaesserella parasuis]
MFKKLLELRQQKAQIETEMRSIHLCISKNHARIKPHDITATPKAR